MSSRIIRSPQSLSYIGIKGVDCLSVRWAPHHAYALNTTRALESPHHPRHELSKRRWEARTDPFWWNCLVSTKVGGNKRVVRGWLNNRARVAITKALKKKGYAKNGSRLAEGAVDCGIGDLVGSAHLQVNPQMLHTSSEELHKQADLIVAAFEERQKKLVTRQGARSAASNGLCGQVESKRITSRRITT